MNSLVALVLQSCMLPLPLFHLEPQPETLFSGFMLVLEQLLVRCIHLRAGIACGKSHCAETYEAALACTVPTVNAKFLSVLLWGISPEAFVSLCTERGPAGSLLLIATVYSTKSKLRDRYDGATKES